MLFLSLHLTFIADVSKIQMCGLNMSCVMGNEIVTNVADGRPFN